MYESFSTDSCKSRPERADDADRMYNGIEDWLAEMSAKKVGKKRDKNTLASGSRDPPPMKAMKARNCENTVGCGWDGKGMARSWRSLVPPEESFESLL